MLALFKDIGQPKASRDQSADGSNDEGPRPYEP